MRFKWFNGINTIGELRHKYKELLVKYHPDNNPDKDTTSIIQEVNSEYQHIFKALKNGFEHSESYSHASEKQKQAYDWEKDVHMREVIKNLVRFQDIKIEICGIWLWISGPGTFKHKKELKELGLHYASQKKMWYIHFDSYYKFGNKSADMNYIRNRYGSSIIQEVKEEEKKEMLYG